MRPDLTPAQLAKLSDDPAQIETALTVFDVLHELLMQDQVMVDGARLGLDGAIVNGLALVGGPDGPEIRLQLARSATSGSRLPLPQRLAGVPLRLVEAGPVTAAGAQPHG
ncbi:hypothetical protein [Maricaulis sp. CAU 1757]